MKEIIHVYSCRDDCPYPSSPGPYSAWCEHPAIKDNPFIINGKDSYDTVPAKCPLKDHPVTTVVTFRRR